MEYSLEKTVCSKSICMPIYLSVCSKSICMPIYLNVCSKSICMPIYLSVCSKSILMPIYLVVCSKSICMPVCVYLQMYESCHTYDPPCLSFPAADYLPCCIYSLTAALFRHLPLLKREIGGG